MEAYRSGHNGTDSKSVDPQGSVGSNPTASAKRNRMIKPIVRFFFLFWTHFGTHFYFYIVYIDFWVCDFSAHSDTMQQTQYVDAVKSTSNDMDNPAIL